MTHPEELLAGYVDGALTEEERAEVDAHLATCWACREEMELSTLAVAALAELPEQPVPLGVMNPVAAEIRRRGAGAAATPWWGRFQWAAGLAAAAALVAVIAVVLPRLGEEEKSAALRAEAGGATPTESVPGADAALARGVFLEIQPDADYSAEDLEALANEAAQRTGLSAVAPGAATVAHAEANAAKACLVEPGGLTEGDRLVRLIRARFDGKPAYLGVYLESPGADRPSNRVVIWVVATKDCRILSFSSKPL
ncbi:MAG: anti-sigma factor family protein [Actinomycetota bacterium]